MDQGTRKLISEVRRNPWVAVYWQACRKGVVACELFSLVDEAIFDRELKRALALAFALEGMAIKSENPHLISKAQASLGSAFRALGHLDMALDQMRLAESLAQGCADCLGNLYRRWAIVLHDQKNFLRALSLFDIALEHFEKTENHVEICSSLLGRSAICRCLGHNHRGFEDARRAIALMAPTMPSRYFITAAVNALSLAVASGDPTSTATALRLIGNLRGITKGIRVHSRPRAILRWIRGLAYEKLGDLKNAARSIENAISSLERLRMIEEKKTAMADLARVRCKGREIETNERHILRLIAETLRLENDAETVQVLKRAKANPSQANILAWRSSLRSYVPSMEPIAESTAIL